MSGRRAKRARKSLSVGRVPAGVTRRWLRRNLRRAGVEASWLLPDLEQDDIPTDHDGGGR